VLRLLHPEIAAEPSRRAGLLAQARAMRRLRHPAPARVLDVIEEPLVAGVVSERIEGESLVDLLDAGRLTGMEAVRVAAEAAAAMEEAHRRQVPHAAIGASRVVLDPEGRIRITGLGRPDACEEPSCLMPLVRELAPLIPALRGRIPPWGVDSGRDCAALIGHLRGIHQRDREDRRRGRRQAGSVVALASIAASLFIFAALAGRPSVGSRDSRAGTLAVLPFQRQGGAPGEWPASTGLGMADSVITSLIGVKWLLVRPTAAIERYAGTPVDPLTAGRELGVDHVLTGEWEPGPGAEALRLRLQEVRTGRAEWEQTVRIGDRDPLAARRFVAEIVLRSLPRAVRGSREPANL
jgi:TolB-like protein